MGLGLYNPQTKARTIPLVCKQYILPIRWLYTTTLYKNLKNPLTSPRCLGEDPIIWSIIFTWFQQTTSKPTLLTFLRYQTENVPPRKRRYIYIHQKLNLDTKNGHIWSRSPFFSKPSFWNLGYPPGNKKTYPTKREKPENHPLKHALQREGICYFVHFPGQGIHVKKFGLV